MSKLVTLPNNIFHMFSESLKVEQSVTNSIIIMRYSFIKNLETQNNSITAVN